MRSRAMEIAAAIQTISLCESGTTGLYVAGERFEITITPNERGLSRIWDQVRIDGCDAGNRYGGATWLLIALGEQDEENTFAWRRAYARRDKIKGAVQTSVSPPEATA